MKPIPDVVHSSVQVFIHLFPTRRRSALYRKETQTPCWQKQPWPLAVGPWPPVSMSSSPYCRGLPRSRSRAPGRRRRSARPRCTPGRRSSRGWSARSVAAFLGGREPGEREKVKLKSARSLNETANKRAKILSSLLRKCKVLVHWSEIYCTVSLHKVFRTSKVQLHE